MKMLRTTKPTLIGLVARDCDLPEATVRRVLDCMLGHIAASVREGYPVELRGFGTFAPRDRAARTGRNLRTGEPIAIPASRALGFKPSKGGK